MKARILVIEDEMSINDLLCMNLEIAGYETVGYLDGNEAYEAIIENMTYSNPYTIGNIKTENLNLLSFSEVMKIYEKMMLVTNADNMQYENSRAYNIDRIVLGYARIYEPSTDAHTGIMIPVWDFFGSMTSESEYNGETESNTSKDPNESFLTINAVDGSIINRNLGY
jgi:CheY-like chemotaxis protein